MPAVIETIDSTDKISDSRAVINENFSAINAAVEATEDLLDALVSGQFKRLSFGSGLLLPVGAAARDSFGPASFLLPKFPPDSAPVFSGAFALPADWIIGSDLTPQIIWCPKTTSGGAVRWLLQYDFMNLGASPLVTLLELGVTSSAGGVAGSPIKASFPILSGVGKTAGSVLAFKLIRDYNHSADTYPDDAGVFELGFRYPVETLGEV